MTLRKFSFLQPRESENVPQRHFKRRALLKANSKIIASSPERSPVATRGFHTSPALKVALNPLYTVVELLLLLN